MRSFLAVGTLAVLFTLPLAAQDARGTILGRVTDPAGAAIPAAEVRAINVATGVSAAARSNESGNYVLPYLIPSLYTLTVELSGFNRFSREGLQVRINDTVEVNIQMRIGDVNQAIEVSAETPLLSTAEASLGQVVDERRVLELPQFAGNAMDLVHLAPGTVNGTNMRLRKAGFNSAPSSSPPTAAATTRTSSPSTASRTPILGRHRRRAWPSRRRSRPSASSRCRPRRSTPPSATPWAAR